MNASARLGLVVSSALALAVIAAAPRVAAVDGRAVTLRESAERVEGRCTYRTTLNGSWTVSRDGTTERARDVVVSVGSTVTCRREPPQSAERQLYFASATESQIAARISEVAAITAQVAPHRTVTFVPTIVCDGGSARVANIRCDEVTADATTATATAP